jgi:flagellar hook-associated protein 3 FlgL
MVQLQSSLHRVQGFVLNIEDVDIAQALAKLNQNQTALQASYHTISQLNQLSLLDYLQ